MDIGVFSRTYEVTDLRETFERMRRDGLRHTQFNFANAGIETLPEKISDGKLCEIRELAAEYEITIDALTGTFNMIAVDQEERERGCNQFEIQCSAAAALEIPVVTLCTGSRNPKSKWEWDDRNLLADAWDDLLKSTEKILRFAEKNNIIFGVETEASNVICTAKRAREYLDVFQTPHLKIIMDGANLFHGGENDCDKVLTDAFDLLERDIVIAHAKDIRFGKKTDFLAAGQGDLNFELYIKRLLESGYQGALIMHGLSEQQISGSRDFLKSIVDNARREHGDD